MDSRSRRMGGGPTTGRSGFLETGGAPTMAEAVDSADFSRSARTSLVFSYKFSMVAVTDAEKRLAATYHSTTRSGSGEAGGSVGAGAGAAAGLSPLVSATGATARKVVRLGGSWGWWLVCWVCHLLVVVAPPCPSLGLCGAARANPWASY
jgi:hypothetical protein